MKLLKFLTFNLLFVAVLQAQLQSGDLVFRQGSGLFSEIARNFSLHDKRFSHVGMILYEKPNYFVVHSIDDATKNFHGVVKEPLESFLKGIEHFAFYRISLERKEVNSVLYRAIQEAKPFDTNFDMQEGSALYCTEFIFEVLNRLKMGSALPSRTFLRGQMFLSIEDILKIEGIKEISP